jgi:hypothetical protein
MEAQPKYPCQMRAISPTALHTFESNSTDFVLNYVMKARRPAQLKVMSIGSAFDARCKAYLTAELCGGNEKEVYTQLFESSVEPHNRDWAMKESEQLFEWYRQAGALADLVIELTGFQAIPRFEFSVNRTIIEKAVHTENATNAIPLTGKPDCYFVNFENAHVILDWKVNGYCSKASPLAGYVRCRDLTGFNEGTYRGTTAIKHKGIYLGYGVPLKSEWNDQLIIYSWMLGNGEVSFDSEEWILGIEQLACNLNAPNENKKLRVASFRLSREPSAARTLWERLTRMWQAVQRGHYFINLSQEESDFRTETIMSGGGDLVWMMRGL